MWAGGGGNVSVFRCTRCGCTMRIAIGPKPCRNTFLKVLDVLITKNITVIAFKFGSDLKVRETFNRKGILPSSCMPPCNPQLQ